MQQMIHKIRDKYTYWILLLFVPLEVLPFSCEPDSTMGKVLLLIKAALLGILYCLYADKQRWYIHVMMLITCASMGISVLMHGGAGTALLILTMFFALITFPKIKIDAERLSTLFLMLAIGGSAIVAFGMIVNYSKGLQALSWRGIFNPNTFGIVILSIYFYLETAMGVNLKNRFSLKNGLVSGAFLFLLIRSGCRSTIICLIALFVCMLVVKEKKYIKRIYYLIVIASLSICFMVILAEQWLNVSIIANDVQLMGKKLFSGRELIWKTSWTGFMESPLWGQPIEYLADTTHLMSAHNVFIGILFSTGLIPSLAYVVLLLVPRFSVIGEDEHEITLNRLCFIISMVLSTFECIYTDNRLNLLFLPLLLGICPQNTDNKCNVKPEKVIKEQITEGKGQLSKSEKIGVLVLCVLVALNLFEPFVKYIRPIVMPLKYNTNFLEKAKEYNSPINLLNDSKYSSREKNGIIWEWNGEAYDVIGTAENLSVVDFYSSPVKIPDWAEPGKQYHVIHESDEIRFRIYYYLSDGQCIRLVDTNTSLNFTLPNQACGLIVRLALNGGANVNEKVMPILYATDCELKAESGAIDPLTYRVNDECLCNDDIEYPMFQNVLGGMHYPSQESAGVLWQWNGSAYDVVGTADSISIVDFFSSSKSLPAWAEPGETYHLIYSADAVRFRVYYYLSDGQYARLVDTTTSCDFVIPDEAQGLIVRLALTEGETAQERVMPIIISSGQTEQIDLRKY